MMALGYVLTVEHDQWERAGIITQNAPRDLDRIVMRGQAGHHISANLAANGWSAVIDDMTGEIMVSTGFSSPYRRFLDTFDRSVFVSSDDEYNRNVMRLLREHVMPGCGIMQRMHGGENPREHYHFWCNRDPNEVRTAFMCCQQTEDSRLIPFRADDTDKRNVPDLSRNTRWNDLTACDGEFSDVYALSLIVSAYLGGTLPYGYHKTGVRTRVVSCSVGGRTDSSPGGAAKPFSVEYQVGHRIGTYPSTYGARYQMPGSRLRVVLPTSSPRDVQDEVAEGIQLSELPDLIDDSNRVDLRHFPTVVTSDGRVLNLADEYGSDEISVREFHRIPRSTPAIYTGGPARVVPVSLRKGAAGSSGSGDGDSTGALAIAGVAAAAIGAYLLLK